MPFTTASKRLSPTEKAALRRAVLSPESLFDFVSVNLLPMSKLEIGNLKLGNAFTSLYFPQFSVSNFTAKTQDQQSVNYF